MDARNRSQGVEPALGVHRAAHERVEDGNLIAPGAEVKCSRPAAVAVSADDQHAVPLALGRLTSSQRRRRGLDGGERVRKTGGSKPASAEAGLR